MTRFAKTRRAGLLLAALIGMAFSAPALAQPSQITIDFATYNPVGLLLKEKGWLEEALSEQGIDVRWVQSQGSNKALEFLNAGSIDFGSTAGAAALVGRVNGNPIKSIYVYSRPEWTALVKPRDSDIREVGDLAGKRIAVTRGTDPHIFLIRALAEHGLGERDVQLVLLQHADGKAALIRGDVDAWAGLDPMMAAGEIEDGAELFYRNTDFNSWGILNVREEFAEENPELVEQVIAAYERAREYALDNPQELVDALVGVARLPAAVIERQLERTDISYSAIGDEQRETLLQAGRALQEASVLDADVDVQSTVDDLIEPKYSSATN